MKYMVIRPWLHIAKRDLCMARTRHEYDGIIHIWRSDYEEQRCDYLKDLGEISTALIVRGPHVCFDYRDGEGISADHLNWIREWLLSGNGPGQPFRRLLVHCAMGICRAPTMGIVCLVVLEGMHPIDAAAEMLKKVTQQRMIVPFLSPKALTSILRWYNDLCLPHRQE